MVRAVLRSSPTSLISAVLIGGQVFLSVPVAARPVAEGPPPTEAETQRAPAPPQVTVNRTVPLVTPPPAEPQFSDQPTVQEIFRARVFGEPLVPVGGEPTAAENRQLADALLALHRSGGFQWRRTIAPFLLAHPQSPWRASLLANLGMLHVREHAFTRALEAWNEAWALAKAGTDAHSRAVADFAVAEWLTLAASFGQIEPVETRLAAIVDRPVSGSAGVKVKAARETIALIKRHPEKTLPCGPQALLALLAVRDGAAAAQPVVLTTYRGTLAGTSLTELESLARRVGLSLQAAAGTGAREIPVPSIVHWKVDHYAAVVERQDDRYRIMDDVRGQSYWVSRDTLFEEASGYFLIPDGPLPDGWRALTDGEGDTISGRGPLCPDGAPGPPGPDDDDDDETDDDEEDPCPPKGMAAYRFQAVTASLLIEDIPLGYVPPRGPAVSLMVSYHHRQSLQPQLFTFANLGPKWTFKWLRFVQEVPADAFGVTPAHVWVSLAGGGREAFANPDAQGVFPAHWYSRSTLVRVSDSPVRYERRLPTGTVEVYTLSNGAPSGQRQVFLTALIDPQGDGLQFTWDSQLRLVAVTDALGQVTTIAYEHASDPLKITKVTDPFGRFATFTYSAAGQLASITDVIGISSAFAYGPNDFISTLTTPYGTTSFRHEPNSLNDLNFRFIEATDPLGGTEHLEFQWQTPTLAATASVSEVPTGFTAWNSNLDHYNTFYWDKRAWALGKNDQSKATITHWMVAAEWPGWQKYSYVPHSIKRPLENRVWFAYPGQVAGAEGELGWFAQPSRIGRVLDDGASQITERTYNTQGSVLSVTDPLARQTSYTYATNGLDLLEVRLTTNVMNELRAAFSNYASLHRPQTFTDAAGQTASYTYNGSGQVLSVTNAKQETTTLTYNTDGYLTSLTGPMSGATGTFTHDAYGRIRTVTGPDGYSVTMDYDVFDRLTRRTYPDGTYDELAYDRLDVSTSRDRRGRLTRYYYDALRRLTATRDPLGRTVTQEWCGCGSLEALTDGNGNRTTWERDLQGRVTREVRPNGSAEQYVYEATTSRLKQRTDANNQQTNHQYFVDGRLQQIAYANAIIATPTVTLTYDTAYGRLATMTDGIGTTSYTYRSAGQLGASRVASVDGPLTNDTLTYGYDELGRVVSRTLNGVTGTWAYDALSRLTTQGDPIGTFTYAYDGATARLTSLTYPNGQTSTYAYLPNSGDRHLQEIHHRTGAGATLSRFAYAYDAVGNITAWTQQYGGTTNAYDFEYDVADQLTAATYRTTDPTPTTLKRYRYAYDPVGNRTSAQVDDAPSTWTYNAMNRLTAKTGGGLVQVGGTVSEPAIVTVQGAPALVDGSNRFSGRVGVAPGTTTFAVTATDASGNSRINHYEFDAASVSETFTYNANGDLTAQGTKTYEWDAANRLVRVRDNGTEVASFGYDGFGRRFQKTAGGVTRAYVYTGEDILEERLPTETLRHVHGPGTDQPLATVNGVGAVAYRAVSTILRQPDSAIYCSNSTVRVSAVD